MYLEVKMKLIRILHVNEKEAVAIIAAAEVSFSMGDNNVLYITRMPSPNECYIPMWLMEKAKKEVKEKIEKEREQSKTKALQAKLPY